jgi:hypothetical protein
MRVIHVRLRQVQVVPDHCQTSVVQEVLKSEDVSPFFRNSMANVWRNLWGLNPHLRQPACLSSPEYLRLQISQVLVVQR